MSRNVKLALSVWLSNGLLTAIVAATPEPGAVDSVENAQASAAIALDILKKADRATKAVKWVQYDISWEGSGWLADRVWQIQGHIISKKATDGTPPAFRYTMLKGIAPQTDQELRYTTGSDGTEFFLIDPQTKKVHRGSDRKAIGRAGRITQSIAMVEYAHATPFTDEITGDKALLLGTETVDGVECHHVYVMYKGGTQEAEWYFSKRDFLPRRVDRIRRNREDEKGKQVCIVRNLQVDSVLPDDAFTVNVPEGYEETTEAAPDPRIPM